VVWHCLTTSNTLNVLFHLILFNWKVIPAVEKPAQNIPVPKSFQNNRYKTSHGSLHRNLVPLLAKPELCWLVILLRGMPVYLLPPSLCHLLTAPSYQERPRDLSVV